jgi:FkbM family methyltransferase
MINWTPREAKKNAFVVASTDHGMMIVNRFDHNTTASGFTYGVCHSLLETSAFDPDEINAMIQILTLLRKHRGDGVVLLDGGANVGVHSLTAGRLMQGWGAVLAFEAQERVFYAAAGNVAMNNLFNVVVRWNALAESPCVINIPAPDYMKASSFGSLEMQYNANSENIGQEIDMSKSTPVQAVSIDSLNLSRLDFLKLDVEAMEEQVIRGASATMTRCKPIVQIEQLKANQLSLNKLIESFGYVVFNIGQNILGVPKDDPILQYIK